MEIWKPIDGYDGDYQVSNLGRVRSLKYKPPRIRELSADGYGYLHVNLHRDGDTKNYSVHRLVATAFLPNPEGKREVNHINGIKTDNRVENLEWVTPSENVRHAVDTGLIKSGEDNYNAKLTNEQARYIRENPDGLSQYRLAEVFGVTQPVIGYIQRNETYKDAGGKACKSKIGRPQVLSEEKQSEIRRLFVKGSREFGARALARMFGVHYHTILRIVRETQ